VLPSLALVAVADPTLVESGCRLAWEHSSSGWCLKTVLVRTANGEIGVGEASGEYTVIYASKPPPTEAPSTSWTGHVDSFPESIYKSVAAKWRDATSPVALNTAGEARRFFPDAVKQVNDREWIFTHTDDLAALLAEWRLR
jgi:hypothetical protein